MNALREIKGKLTKFVSPVDFDQDSPYLELAERTNKKAAEANDHSVFFQ